MAYNITDALGLIIDDTADFEEESDIEEDPYFPLPHTSDCETDSDPG